MYIIVVGCGSLGAGLAKELSIYGHDVVVIDKDSNAFKLLGTEFNGVTILGTGIDEDVLKKAGIGQADVFVAVTNTDSVNVMAAQVAKHIFKIRKVITRIYNPEKGYVYNELGLDTICPNSISIETVKRRIISEDLSSLIQIGSGDAQIIEVNVRSYLVGRDVKSLEIPHKFKAIGIIRGSETLIAYDELRLAEGDKILAVARLDAIETIKDLLLGSER
jgi:trk system potassium uptake protein TrkA